MEHRVNGRLLWDLHLGPDAEFALYDHKVDGDHDHADRENLLAPGYVYGARAGQAWTVPSLRLWISVVRAGEPEANCESFFVKVVRQ